MSVVVQGLSKLYDTQKAVDNISFSVDRGTILGFLGPNGAGKSTTMKMLTGYIPPSAGTATICSKDIITDSIAARKHIGYLPENNPLYYDMYVKEYLQFVAQSYKLQPQHINSRIDTLIDMTGLGVEKHKKIGQLSKGYKQRVGLAQAMIHDPEVLILDEPTSGLDPNQLSDIRTLIKSLGKDKTIIFSTHIMQEVEAVCDRVIIINKGNIVADEGIQQLKTKSGKTQKIHVSFDRAIAVDTLKSLPAISKVETLSPSSFAIHTSDVARTKNELMKYAVAQQLIITSMVDDTKSIENVFQELTK